jgi:hypothetical protein
LKAKGLRYYADEGCGVFYVQKGPLLKFRDYTFRAFGTPVAVIVDAVTTIVVVGVYMNVDSVRKDLT